MFVARTGSHGLPSPQLTAFFTSADRGGGHPGREHEVALAIARGRTNADIAAELAMGITTVKAHVSSILTKLGLDNRTQITLLAHDSGLA
ncbi:response regulator transcription factor [Nonomuraea turkmeniaca]|uniref:Response regulator transcription factor n=1 Tax=Nonomuraea turkmeniaca TaxID=103838 RepID=A0A5S4FVN8_9ACTN|nr:response regulator transcription factor [Nonomuraea turkmeniaca]